MVALVLSIGMLVSGGIGAQAASKPVQAKVLEDALKSYVVDAEARVEAMPMWEPWQKSVYFSEVVPQYRRFIKQYRQSGDKILADVDIPTIRKYLSFHSMRLGRPDLKMGYVVMADPACAACKSAVAEIKTLAKARIERRGFKAIALVPSEAGPGTEPTDAEAIAEWPDRRDKLIALSFQKEQAASLIVEIVPGQVDAIDTAHADEKKYWVRAHLLGKNGIKEFKSEGKLEILDSNKNKDNIVQGFERVLTDAFTEVGSETLTLAESEQRGKVIPEILIRVRGIMAYQEFLKAKAKIEEVIGELQERSLRRGEATFGIRTPREIDEIKVLVAKAFTDASLSHSFDVKTSEGLWPEEMEPKKE